MCSKRKAKHSSTVTFRLTLLFVTLFALLLIGVLIPIDVTLRSILTQRLDTKISGHLAGFSYYAFLFDRKPREEAIAVITDNIGWAAKIVGEDQVLWLMLSGSWTVLRG